MSIEHDNVALEGPPQGWVDCHSHQFEPHKPKPIDVDGKEYQPHLNGTYTQVINEDWSQNFVGVE